VIDYLTGQVTGGVGREIGKIDQSVRSLFTGEELPTHKIPVLGRFYGNATGGARHADEFYRNIREINVHASEVEGRERAGEPTGEYEKRHPEAGMKRMADKYYDRVAKLRQMRAQALKEGANRGKIKSIEDDLTELMSSFNAEVTRERESARAGR
jgi:hypothetical protein